MDYIEVSVRIDPFKEEFADIVIAEIEELGFESYLTESPYLKAYIPQNLFHEPNLKTKLWAIGCELFKVEYTLNYIKEQNWNAVWESAFEPVVVKNRCTVKASFHKGLPRTKYTIKIDPKMAFGTGHHQTTSLMIEMMLEMEKEIKGLQVLDMGCGTGILSILAAKMKAEPPVHAIDIDQTAVYSALENNYKNKVAEKIKTLCGDASLLQKGKYDLILANINRNILLEDMSTYVRSLRPGGILIVSGFYEEDIIMLRTQATKCGLKYLCHKTKENWAAVKFLLDVTEDR